MLIRSQIHTDAYPHTLNRANLHTCVYRHSHTYINANTNALTRAHSHRHAHTHTRAHTYTRTHTHSHTHTLTFIHIYIYTQAHPQAQMHIYRHIHIPPNTSMVYKHIMFCACIWYSHIYVRCTFRSLLQNLSPALSYLALLDLQKMG